jgi:hypothetical protein
VSAEHQPRTAEHPILLTCPQCLKPMGIKTIETDRGRRIVTLVCDGCGTEAKQETFSRKGAPIHDLMEGAAFDQIQIEKLVYAFEAACTDLQISDRDTAARERVAGVVFDSARRGLLEPEALRAATVRAMKL